MYERLIRGKQRLRIAPVDDIRRRWGSSIAAEKSFSREEVSVVSAVHGFSTEDGCMDENDDGIEWTESVESLQVSPDPLHGLRPRGFMTCFWGAGEEPCSIPVSAFSSPSTMSMKKRASASSFAMADIEVTMNLLEDPVTSAKIISSSTPSLMDPSTARAREIVSNLFSSNHSGKPWRGPLPPPRVSWQMTLGAAL